MHTQPFSGTVGHRILVGTPLLLTTLGVMATPPSAVGVARRLGNVEAREAALEERGKQVSEKDQEVTIGVHANKMERLALVELRGGLDQQRAALVAMEQRVNLQAAAREAALEERERKVSEKEKEVKQEVDANKNERLALVELRGGLDQQRAALVAMEQRLNLQASSLDAREGRLARVEEDSKGGMGKDEGTGEQAAEGGTSKDEGKGKDCEHRRRRPRGKGKRRRGGVDEVGDDDPSDLGPWY